MNYDPNFFDHNTNYQNDTIPQMIVDVTFQMWDFSNTISLAIVGYWRGKDLVEQILEEATDYFGGKKRGEITLKNAAGDENTAELWEFPLEEMLVGFKILSIDLVKQK